jgi:hypothetical protein
MTEMEAVRGSAPAMSTKDLLLEVYQDMKIIRPIVEHYVGENLPTRVRGLEQDRIVREAVSVDRRHTLGMTNKALAAIILVSQFVLGIWVILSRAT